MAADCADRALAETSRIAIAYRMEAPAAERYQYRVKYVWAVLNR